MQLSFETLEDRRAWFMGPMATMTMTPSPRFRRGLAVPLEHEPTFRQPPPAGYDRFIDADEFRVDAPAPRLFAFVEVE